MYVHGTLAFLGWGWVAWLYTTERTTERGHWDIAESGRMVRWILLNLISCQGHHTWLISTFNTVIIMIIRMKLAAIFVQSSSPVKPVESVLPDRIFLYFLFLSIISYMCPITRFCQYFKSVKWSLFDLTLVARRVFCRHWLCHNKYAHSTRPCASICLLINLASGSGIQK